VGGQRWGPAGLGRSLRGSLPRLPCLTGPGGPGGTREAGLTVGIRLFIGLLDRTRTSAPEIQSVLPARVALPLSGSQRL
jgi:hypothetical protein